MKRTRIPRLTATTAAAAKSWFRRMLASDLQFHPDDDPATIILISDGSKTFSSLECEQLRDYLAELLAALGDTVYDFAFDALSVKFHTRSERRSFTAMSG